MRISLCKFSSLSHLVYSLSNGAMGILNPINPELVGLKLTMDGGGCFLPPVVTLLSLKLCDPNLVQRYFGIRSIFCSKKNQDQMDNTVIMT